MPLGAAASLSRPATVLLGAIAGFTIFLGLPVARLRGAPRLRPFLGSLATGILVFLLVDIVGAATEQVSDALHSGAAHFLPPAAAFVGGVAAGLLALVLVDEGLTARAKATSAGLPVTYGRRLAMAIAC